MYQLLGFMYQLLDLMYQLHTQSLPLRVVSGFV